MPLSGSLRTSRDSPRTRLAFAAVLALASCPLQASPRARTFAIVFDDLHVGDLNVEPARRAIESFVETQCRPGDRLVLVTTSNGRFWATTRAGDLAWREAVRGLRSRTPPLSPIKDACLMTHYEAMQVIDFGNGLMATARGAR